MAASFKDFYTADAGRLASDEPTNIAAALGHIEEGLGDYDAAAIASGELRSEFDAMVRLYRATRAADELMQQRFRSSEIGEQLLRVYYGLRTTQASLSMRYAVEGRAVDAPEMSPVGTAIGLFDAPKVLAQPTHLLSGSYDADLAGFVGWMEEIWTDMRIRRSDYLRFYGETDVAAAAGVLSEMLSLEADGNPELRPFGPGQTDDPASLLDRLRQWAGDGSDLAAAARAIQEIGSAARYSLISLIAHRSLYEGRLGLDRAADVERSLQEAISWRFPVGETPLFDLAAEQEAFDRLLAQVPGSSGSRLPASDGWADKAVTALRRACAIEQSLRDHADEYSERYSDARSRRSFRWYIWEFLGLSDRATADRLLGARVTRAT